jgi:hypothetical protein
MDFAYFVRHYGWLIEIVGMVSIVCLACKGVRWLVDDVMSQDVSAYQILDQFYVMHAQSATPLETQREGKNER